MPTRLARTRSQQIASLQDQARASGVRQRTILRAGPPWPGFTPDVPHDLATIAHARNLRGLRPRPHPSGFGEVLMPDSGWAQLDPTNLPLSARAAVHLTQLSRTTSAGAISGDQDVTPIAATGGTGSAGTHQLWRLRPTTGAWQEIAYSAAGSGAMGADRDGSTDAPSMPHSCEFPPGAPGRSVLGGAIAEPVLIYCNNVDRVMVYPDQTGGSDYEELTTLASLDPFIARSCANFAGRVNFLNTSENGTRRRNRLRYTPVFTADPDTSSLVGGGTHDFEEFSGEGQKVLPLGDVLACYFDDGVAFARRTDIPTFPYRYEIISTERGLLSCTGITSIEGRLHFGVFTDGWYFVDPSGRFREAGIQEFDGVRIRKWRETFFNRFDIENRQRLQVHYDSMENVIRIAIPTQDNTEMVEYWVYDILGDRVSVEDAEVTCWGSYNQQIRAATTWGGTAPETWSSILGSWGSYAGRLGLTAQVHGDAAGNVYIHDPDILTREQPDNSLVFPVYEFESLQPTLGSPEDLMSVHRVNVEYVNVNSPGGTVRVASSQRSASRSIDYNEGATGTIQTSRRSFHFTDQQVGFQLTGTHPWVGRSVAMEVQGTSSSEKDS